MKNRKFYLGMAIIWGVGVLAWIACLVQDVYSGEVNPLRVVACICSIICFALNLFIYCRGRKKET